MAQPTDLPTWATSATGLAATTVPTVGKQADGWAPSEKPPAQYFNFWMNRVGQWCSYLKNLAGEALTWTSKHTFAAGLASSVAPAAATDVVRKTELDAMFAFGGAIYAYQALWAASTPTPGATAAGGVVQLYGNVVTTASAAGPYVADVPLALRPTATRTCYAWALISAIPVCLELRILTSGNINLVRRADGTALGTFPTGTVLQLDGISYSL